MLIAEWKPIAVMIALAFGRKASPTKRIYRVRVLFPDLGAVPVLHQIGLARYPGEKSLVKPDATDEELALPGGLTINL